MGGVIKLNDNAFPLLLLGDCRETLKTIPPDLIEPCILAGSRPGDIVLDPFGGSGTTAGAAIKHGKKTILCELNPDCAALVPERVASIVGRPAHDNDNDAQISMLEILEGYE